MRLLNLGMVLSVFLGAQIGCAYELEIDPNIYTNKYGSYFVPLNHFRPAVEAIKRGEVYEKNTLEYIEKIYEKGTDVVHAGAYFGDMLPFFSSLADKNSVWAFEPVALHFFCAKKNALLNDLKNVRLFQSALSDRAESLRMQIKKNGRPLGGASTIKEGLSFNQNDEFEWIQSTRLDDTLSDQPMRISLIHLDVEGHEISALNGSRHLIDKHRPVIIVELWKINEEKINAYMSSIDYKFVKKVDENGVYFPNEK